MSKATNKDDGVMRTFATGATRDTAEDKLDYEGFLSPLSLEAFAQYLHFHRIQSDGTPRDSDNWQRGIPQDTYMKSLWRHFVDLWKAYRTATGWRFRTPITDVEVRAQRMGMIWALAALMFNVQGLMHELLRDDPQLMKHALRGRELVRDADPKGPVELGR